MDAKPRSNKQKCLEKKRKLELAAAVLEAEEKLARAGN
jgi:hypothetical protein